MQRRGKSAVSALAVMAACSATVVALMFDRWVGYTMPEPWAHDRRTWIDNSTTPVTVWYVDQNGYMVRIQPLD